MAPTSNDLRQLVGVGTSSASESSLQGYIDTAVAIVDEHLQGLAEGVVVPPAVVDRAYLLVAAEMFNQDQAPNGILNQQYETDGGPVVSPVRISADPMRPAYSLLSPWRTVTIA